MKIRTITFFTNPGFPMDAARLAEAGQATAAVRRALEESGFAVQSTRLASLPFPAVVGGQAAKVVPFARELEAASREQGFDYAAIGAVRMGDADALAEAIPEALGETEAVFASAIIADPAEGISLPVIRRTAEIIARCAGISPDGFGNLRFAALAQAPAGTPFLPAAYHDGGPPRFAIGMEAADLAVTAFADSDSLAEARGRLSESVHAAGRTIAQLAAGVSARCGVAFGGIDFSLAPYPDAAHSIGTALERLSGNRVGEHCTLAAAAFIAAALDAPPFPQTGFHGLFLPVFEDAILARRAADGVLTTRELLLYSSVCGTGIDTVPVPGETPLPLLAAILLDIAALASRLRKPLTARLMPIPGKHAGDEVSFDFPFFAPSRVLNPGSGGLGGLFAGDETFALEPRQRSG